MPLSPVCGHGVVRLIFVGRTRQKKAWPLPTAALHVRACAAIPLVGKSLWGRRQSV